MVKYLLLVWIKIVVLSSNDLWDEAGGRGTADCGRGQRVLRKRQECIVKLVFFKKHLAIYNPTDLGYTSTDRNSSTCNIIYDKQTQLNQERKGISTFLRQNWPRCKEYSYQVSGILPLWRVAGVEAVPGCALWAGTGWLSWVKILWRSRSKPTRYLEVGWNTTLHNLLPNCCRIIYSVSYHKWPTVIWMQNQYIHFLCLHWCCLDLNLPRLSAAN